MTSAKDFAFLTLRLAAGVFEGVSLATELFRVVFRAGVFAARVTGGSMFSKVKVHTFEQSSGQAGK